MSSIDRIGFALALMVVAGAAAASSGKLAFQFDAEPTNQPSLQRGARDFMHYCSGCHSMKYLRYNRIAQDLEIPEDLMKKYLMVTSDKVGDTIISAMPAESEQWFGRKPPDLSLTTRLRGPSWVYSYLLSFYLDPARP